MGSHLENLAIKLGRSADQLQELEYRPLALAFVPGSFVTYVVRDSVSGEILEVTLDLNTGATADPEALRQLDQGRGAIEGGKFSSDLLSLVLRHASLDSVMVRVRFLPDAVQANGQQDEDLDQQLQTQLVVELQQLEIELLQKKFCSDLEVELTLSVRQIVRLGASQLVQSIELVGEPEIPD